LDALPSQSIAGAGPSNRAPRGRKNDFTDGERLVKRLVAQEMVLSFVPEAEPRPQNAAPVTIPLHRPAAC
jgi:hypothetical protein